MEGLETMDNLYSSLTQKRSQVPPAEAGQAFGDSIRVLFRPQHEPLSDNERFLASIHFEPRVKLDQLGIELGSID